jgi:hypothetical protein
MVKSTTELTSQLSPKTFLFSSISREKSRKKETQMKTRICFLRFSEVWKLRLSYNWRKIKRTSLLSLHQEKAEMQ